MVLLGWTTVLQSTGYTHCVMTSTNLLCPCVCVCVCVCVFPGHYISDVYSVGDHEWKTYNDSLVADTREEDVRQRRQCTGYIFFYMHK